MYALIAITIDRGGNVSRAYSMNEFQDQASCLEAKKIMEQGTQGLIYKTLYVCVEVGK